MRGVVLWAGARILKKDPLAWGSRTPSRGAPLLGQAYPQQGCPSSRLGAYPVRVPTLVGWANPLARASRNLGP